MSQLARLSDGYDMDREQRERFWKQLRDESSRMLDEHLFQLQIDEAKAKKSEEHKMVIILSPPGEHKYIVTCEELMSYYRSNRQGPEPDWKPIPESPTLTQHYMEDDCNGCDDGCAVCCKYDPKNKCYCSVRGNFTCQAHRAADYTSPSPTVPLAAPETSSAPRSAH
jgi:hypothetical protein